MKKRGYTLAETLVTLGIIGITAALIGPAMKQLIPSKEKMEFMECYKQLTVAIQELPNYYTPTVVWHQDLNKFVPTCIGMACNSGYEPCDKEVNQGETKLKCLLNKIVGNDKYTWEADTNTKEGNDPQHPVPYTYATGHSLTCKSPNYEFKFELKGNGSIKDIGDKGRLFMKDQFNYYNKGEEKDE